MPIKDIEFKDDGPDQLTVTLRGNPQELIKALVNGLPNATLRELQAAFDDEMSKRLARV